MPAAASNWCKEAESAPGAQCGDPAPCPPGERGAGAGWDPLPDVCPGEDVDVAGLRGAFECAWVRESPGAGPPDEGDTLEGPEDGDEHPVTARAAATARVRTA
ncbi:hypothetical protein GCM10009863_65110 [Streptomyces axinellae]|uniref:Uncharacterized protein n=1 Tax=Streptomyces axinellae TaxID=552788 RepID=A0ABP6DF05_9ACTN